MALIVDIEKQIGTFHLKTAFEVKQGETFGLLGESGCGKSMTLKCIAGIETPDRGSIVLNDRILFDSRKHINRIPQKRKVGYLFQDYALFPNMTVEENIRIVLKKSEPVKDYIRAFYLEGLEKHYPFMLSGGQKQRCALARMMAAKPELLLFDEPFSAVDKSLKWKLELQVLEVLERTKKTAVFVTHNKEEMDHLCGNIGIMSEGKMKEIGKKETIFSDPKTVAAAKLAGCQNIFPVQKGNYSHVGIPNQSVRFSHSKSETNLSGTIERIFYGENVVFLIRMKHGIFFYEFPSKYLKEECLIGDRVDLYVNPEKIWYLND